MMFPITKPGIYDVPIDDYHNREICDAPSIGGSGLVMLAPPEANAEKFWDQSTLNPNREPVDTAALRAGKCFHTLYLEGIDAVQRHFMIDDLPRSGEGSANALKAFKAAAHADGKIIIRAVGNTQETGWDEIQAMVKKVAAVPRFQAAFSDGVAEQTLVWRDQETGVWCRARPDWRPFDVTHLPELKSARSAAHSDFCKAIDDYSYHIKAAHLMEGCRALGLGDPQTFTHYVVESSRPYCWAIHTIPREDIEWGIAQRRIGLQNFARCLETGKWPGHPEHVQETGLPTYRRLQLQAADLAPLTIQENEHEYGYRNDLTLLDAG